MDMIGVELARGTDSTKLLEQVLIAGDLSKLTPADRLEYYRMVCESVGLNPLTRPLDYITLSGKLTLYAKAEAGHQLRRKHGVSITEVFGVYDEGLYIVTAKAKVHAMDGSDRTDMAMGAVNLEGLQGEARANGIMKAETKAKRRVTLSICGLGMLDESELSGHPDALPADVDPTTGEVVENERAKTLTQIKEYCEKLNLSKAEKGKLWSDALGGQRVDPRLVDQAILTDLCEMLRKRVEEKA
jgi:hypothetical protein